MQQMVNFLHNRWTVKYLSTLSKNKIKISLSNFLTGCFHSPTPVLALPTKSLSLYMCVWHCAPEIKRYVLVYVCVCVRRSCLEFKCIIEKAKKLPYTMKPNYISLPPFNCYNNFKYTHLYRERVAYWKIQGVDSIHINQQNYYSSPPHSRINVNFQYPPLLFSTSPHLNLTLFFSLSYHTLSRQPRHRSLGSSPSTHLSSTPPSLL